MFNFKQLVNVSKPCEIVKMLKIVFLKFLKICFPSIYERRYVNSPIYFKHYFFQKLLRFNAKAY